MLQFVASRLKSTRRPDVIGQGPRELQGTVTTMIPRNLTAGTMRTSTLRFGHQMHRSFAHYPAMQYTPPPPSLVKAIMYGSQKGQELQREMEQSYSKVLARGKYVHKMNQHYVKPDKVDQYIALMYGPSLSFFSSKVLRRFGLICVF